MAPHLWDSKQTNAACSHSNPHSIQPDTTSVTPTHSATHANASICKRQQDSQASVYNAGTMPGFLGTGVEAGSIQRIRDSFVDQQFRQESNKLGYWESRSQAISQMEDVLNEPSAYGLSEITERILAIIARPHRQPGKRRCTSSRRPTRNCSGGFVQLYA